MRDPLARLSRAAPAPGAGAELSRGELARYSLFAAPLAMAALPIYVHVPKLYAELGMPLTALGALLLVLRFADAFVDPLLGRWSDQLPSRFVACALAALLLALGMLLLLNPGWRGLPLSIWLSGSLVLVYLGFSLASIAHGAWGAERPYSPGARTTLTASREAVGLVGVLVAAALPSLLGPSGQGASADGLARFAWLFVGVLAIALLALWGVSERKQPLQPHARALSIVLRDGRFRRLLAVFALNGIASAIPATLILFFIDDVLEAKDWEALFLVVYFLAGALAMPAWVLLSQRLGKVAAWALGMALAVAAFVWAASFGAGDRVPFLIVCMATGVALGADLALPPSLLADAIARRGTQAYSGSYFGIWAFVTKVNLALAAGLALPAVAWFGYREGDPTSNLAALTAAYTLLPCALKLAALALLVRFRHRLSESLA
ncbi:MAG: MFS transporter [Casimicrobiaceae bacterium]|nr:MFS transporter [Casimicrobiaceae bacterium]MDW8313017.1 MFS transporter [Burkholderiales bacterium]